MRPHRSMYRLLALVDVSSTHLSGLAIRPLAAPLSARLRFMSFIIHSIGYFASIRIADGMLVDGGE